jgi:predicted transcriptional regulator
VGIFLGLYPVQQLLLQEPPQLALSLTEGMRGDIPETCPRNEGAGVHLENLCRRFSLSPEDRMTLPEMRLLITAILLAEELNFSRVAERLHIDQSTVSRRIDELDGELGYLLFNHNHQMVELKEAGRKFVEDARLGVLHIERAAQSGRAANQDADVFFTSAGRLTPIPF